MEVGVDFGILIPLFFTLIIIFGPLIRAISDKDWNEIIVDLIILSCFWGGYLLLTQFEIDEMDILNRILN
jgi:hypothetical protein